MWRRVGSLLPARHYFKQFFNNQTPPTQILRPGAVISTVQRGKPTHLKLNGRRQHDLRCKKSQSHIARKHTDVWQAKLHANACDTDWSENAQGCRDTVFLPQECQTQFSLTTWAPATLRSKATQNPSFAPQAATMCFARLLRLWSTPTRRSSEAGLSTEKDHGLGHSSLVVCSSSFTTKSSSTPRTSHISEMK